MHKEMTEGNSVMKKSYEEAILNENWEAMQSYYTEENRLSLLFPLTVAQDTAFHMAVYSKTKQPLQHLLEIAENDPLTDTAYTIKNAFGNTALHLAAMVGNFEAVQLLVERDSDLLKTTNNLGETPLFKAASYGSTKIVNFLARRPEQMTPQKKLETIHRQRQSFYGEPGASILHVTIQGEHFGTALELLALDKSLAVEEDKSRMSSLQLLANIPSAFKSGYPMGLLKQFLYWGLPVFNDNNDDTDNISYNNEKAGETSRDIETGLVNGDHDHNKGFHGRILAVSKIFSQFFWRILFDGRPKMGKIWKQKRKHKFALKLAKFLIERDNTWEKSISEDTSSYFKAIGDHPNEDPKPEDSKTKQAEVGRPPRETKLETGKGKQAEDKPPQSIGQPAGGKSPDFHRHETPLLAATRKGIVEIVNEVLRVHPQAVEHYSHLQQNILHVAVLHRQKEIFDFVKRMRIPMSRLVGGIDKYGYTILHCVADMENYTGGSRPGPAYQLQDELKWFKRVEKLVPPHFAMHHDIKSNLTAKQLFNKQHKDQLKEAQKWIKETSQSCSTVAALVATVVFAAAYTVPGGSNERGLPNFLDSPIFLFFTIMDIVSLAGSLTSIVMFLSILTSPFDFEDFRKSLPRKLTFGFALLFLSVATTMLAFTATILLVIRLEPRRWTSTLIYTAAFIPVSILALTQFPLYVAFVETLMNVTKVIRKTLPLNLARRLFPNHRLFAQKKTDLHSN